MATAVRNKRGKSSPSADTGAPTASNPLISNAKLRQLYSTMLQCRLLDERTQALRARGAKSAPFLASEAAITGAVLDLRTDDWLLPLENDLLGRFVKGAPLASLLSSFRESQTRRATKTPMPATPGANTNDSALHVLPSAANPAAQLNLASGVALVLQAKKAGNIVMAFCGETSGSGQRWQEALSFAAKHCLPLLLVGYSQLPNKSAAVSKKSASVSRSIDENACGLPVIPVDADDVVAMYRVAYESIHKARHGGGPTLIQAVALPRKKDANGEASGAIAKMETYLAAKGLHSSSWKQKLIDDFNRDADIALNAPKKLSLRNRESM